MPTVWEQYATTLLSPHINGIDQARWLAERGQVEEARDILISCAKAAWQYRYSTAREYSLRRLGEELDVKRFPELAPVAEVLIAEELGSAAQFLDYLRKRNRPDTEAYVNTPSPVDEDFTPEGKWSLALWHAWVTTGRTDAKAAMDACIAQYLDPHVVISWHESAGCWANLVMSALRHGGIDDEALCMLVLFGLYHAEQCNDAMHLAVPAQPSIGGNHLLAWITAWLNFTVLFPEFRRTPSLQFSAIARLDDEISKQVTADGSMIEGCPGYQNCCLCGAATFLTLAERHGLVYPARIRAAFERMIHFVIGLTKPDLHVPYFGDSQDAHVPGYLWQVNKHYDIPELQWVVSQRKEGTEPAYTSRAFTNIGYYVQRTGWGPDDLYLGFDGGRMGQAHCHEDKLNFELAAYGRNFIVDSGNHSYSGHWLAQWLLLSQAHNTVIVDGAGQCRWREDRAEWYSHVPLHNPWHTDDTWDLAEAEFSGPFEWEIGHVTIRRRVVFHKGTPPFWWITDTVEGPGAHEIETLFHFANDIEMVEILPAGVRTRIPGGPELAILSPQVETGLVTVSKHRGERDPVRGWADYQMYRETPAWEVHFSGKTLLPMRRDFILLPWREELPEEFSAVIEGEVISLRIGGKEYRITVPEFV